MSFRGFWFDMTGKKMRRMKPWELLEVKRIYAKHADIRLDVAEVQRQME